MSIVSNNIRYLRRLKGFTQEQFAIKIGIKRSLLGAYEEARANPNLENLQTMALIFGTSVDEIITTDITKNIADERIFSNDLFTNNNSDNKKQLISNNQSLNEMNNMVENIAKNEIIYTQNNIFSIVKRANTSEYLNKRLHNSFIQSLETMSLPDLEKNKTYRGFEIGEDFSFMNALLIGEQLHHLHEMMDGKNYLIVSKNNGIIYRRIYNQTNTRGTILLSSDNLGIATVELQVKEILEIWDIIAFMSFQMPTPQASLSSIKQLVNELQHELSKK